MDKNTLSHTSWECKYHIVFAPKYRNITERFASLELSMGKLRSSFKSSYSKTRV